MDRSDVKRIFTQAPKDSILLGKLSLSFSKDADRFWSFNLKDCDLGIKIKQEFTKFNQTYKVIDMTLVVASKGTKDKVSQVKNIHPFKIDGLASGKDIFLEECFIWFVERIQDILKGQLHVKVFTKPELMPIYGAKDVVNIFFNKNYPGYAEVNTNRIYPEDFYKELKEFQKNVLKYNKERKVQHEKLSSVLRPYQSRAVQWMISRENDELQMGSTNWINDYDAVRLKSLCGRTLCYCPHEEVLTCKLLYDPPKYFRGGILADEMGLGKTVDVIAVVLNNPRKIEEEPDNEEFLIPKVKLPDLRLVKKRAVIDKSNYIKKKRRKGCDGEEIKVENIWCICGDRDYKPEEEFVQCPDCLFYQHKECCHYDENLIYYCTLCWEKQKLLKSKSTLIVVPESICNQWKEEIAKHVVGNAWDRGVFMYTSFDDSFVQPSVLGSYDIVLTTYEVLNKEFFYMPPRRENSRFLRKISPILRVQWWRLCLDEAQAVKYEDEEVESTAIAVKIARSIPAVNQWNITGTPIQGSIKDLQDLTQWIGPETPFDDVFWTNCLIKPFWQGKKTPIFSVLSQIFWRNSKQDVANECDIPPVTTVVHTLKFTPVEYSFYMREHSAVLNLFLDKINRLMLDLTSTLDSLETKTLKMILGPMLSLRQACSHHLAVRNNDVSDELDRFNKIKKGEGNGNMTVEDLLEYLIRKTESECQKDLMMCLASIYDLSGIYCVLKDWPSALVQYRKGTALTEEYAKKQISTELPTNVSYVTEAFDRMISKHPTGIPENKSLDEIGKDLELNYFLLKSKDKYNDKRRELAQFFVSSSRMSPNVIGNAWKLLIFSLPVRALSRKVRNEFDKENLRNDKLLADMEGTLDIWWDDLRQRRDAVWDCLNALYNSEFDDIVSKAVPCHIRPDGNADSCDLCTCRSLIKEYAIPAKNEYSTVKILLREIIDMVGDDKKRRGFASAVRHKETLKKLKMEFLRMEQVLDALRDLITEKDRLRLVKTQTDLIKKSKSIMSQLKKKHGSLVYLKNLKNIDISDRDPCPICFEFFENEWCVLECGHFYCLNCIAKLVKKTKEIECPVCREVTRASDVGLVHLNQETADGSPVHYSTKVDAIIKTLSDLKSSDPDVKVLIFSTWDIVLNVLGRALRLFEISYRQMSGDNFLEQINEFKDPNLNVTALLLPISNGCKGLNLTEATHVFFIEPLLNPDEELQAIGRVHRMGQTKETVIHKFVISGTIEEKIHGTVSHARSKWTDQKAVTLNDLRNLFEIDSLKEYQSREALLENMQM